MEYREIQNSVNTVENIGITGKTLGIQRKHWENIGNTRKTQGSMLEHVIDIMISGINNIRDNVSLIYQMVRCRRYASSPSPSD